MRSQWRIRTVRREIDLTRLPSPEGVHRRRNRENRWQDKWTIWNCVGVEEPCRTTEIEEQANAFQTTMQNFMGEAWKSIETSTKDTILPMEKPFWLSISSFSKPEHPVGISGHLSRGARCTVLSKSPDASVRLWSRKRLHTAFFCDRSSTKFYLRQNRPHVQENTENCWVVFIPGIAYSISSTVYCTTRWFR